MLPFGSRDVVYFVPLREAFELKTIPIYQVDAFTAAAFGGNPAGVAPEADGLTTEQMQIIAREMSVSETAFVTAPTPAGRAAGADMRVRFFTVSDEVKICGHATIGTFFFLAEEGLLPAAATASAPLILRQETGAGVLPVRIHFAPAAGPGSAAGSRRDGGGGSAVERVMMVQAPPQILRTLDRDEVDRLEALLYPKVGLKARLIDRSAPIQVVSTGLPDIIVPVRTMEDLLAMSPDFPALAEYCRAAGVISVHAFTREVVQPGATAHGRDFSPVVGIPEEPATGTANGALGAYLVLHGEVPIGTRMLMEQGHCLGRPSVIEVEIIRAAGGAALETRVGGQAVTTLRGRMRLP
jgi:trans-2,3-dihydro-3-hydroxyanthranilate isomerase